MPRSFLVKQQDKIGEKQADHDNTIPLARQDVPVPSLPPPLLKVSPRSSKSSIVATDDRPAPRLITRPHSKSDYQSIKDEHKGSFYSAMTSHMVERSSKEVWMCPRMHVYDDYTGVRHVSYNGNHGNHGCDGMTEYMESRHGEPRYLIHQHTIDKKPIIEPYNPYHVIHREPIRYQHALYGNIGYYRPKENTSYNHVTMMPKYYVPAIADNTMVSGYNNKDDVKEQEIEEDGKEEKQSEHSEHSEEMASPDSTQSSQEVVVHEESKVASSTSSSPPRTEGKPAKKYRYTCDVCGKSFSRSNTLTTHKRIHTGDKPFHCEQCGRAFRQPGNLTRHRLTHTAIKPYVCPQCNKAFNRASNLHTHMRTHTNYKPFVCDFCGKGFHQKIDMKIHRYTHTGEKPHKCSKCGRGFKQLTHLTYHMRTHSDERLYKCEYCGKGFNQKGNLQAHVYGHTGERPFKCEICGKGFTLASTLNTHKRTHATKKPFDCQFCGKAFYQKNALKTHYIASHPFANGVSLL